jgi:hypothetical protein
MIRDRNTGGGGGTTNQTMNMHIQSLDPSSLAQIVMKNPELFAQASASALRSGFQPYRG